MLAERAGVGYFEGRKAGAGYYGRPGGGRHFSTGFALGRIAASAFERVSGMKDGVVVDLLGETQDGGRGWRGAEDWNSIA